MDIPRLCAALKERVAARLHEAADPAQRGEILIEALYEVSRSVLPELGSPRKSREYLEGQGAVLDLIAFLAMPLVRGAWHERRWVAVLSEIGEGCLDPLLKKKLHVYAQELLAKSGPEGAASASGAGRLARIAAGCAAGLLALFLAWSAFGPVPEPAGRPAAAAPEAHSAPLAGSAYAPPAQAPAGAGAGARGRNEVASGETDSSPPAAGSAPRAEQTSRVRIVNSQVLVPVTVKNCGETVRVELLLDTGATRTAIHEGLAGRLGIDLRQARSSQAELADGRLVRSRIARIDALLAGPFTATSLEVELIPYSGTAAAHDGLLGMDFLGRHRYQIDMEHELIRWF